MKKTLIILSAAAILVACNPYEEPDNTAADGSTSDTLQPDAGIQDTGGGGDRGAVEAGADRGPGADSGTPGAEEILPAGATATWGKRTCDVKLTYYAPGASSVKLAGSFTNWDKGAIAMTQLGSNWTTTLKPNSTTLVSGTRYPYKFIVDTTWKLDSAAPLRVFDGNCVNSGFELPPCDKAPLITPGKVAATYSGGTGSVKVKVTIHTASDVDWYSLDIDPSWLPPQCWPGCRPMLWIDVVPHNSNLIIEVRSASGSPEDEGGSCHRRGQGERRHL